MRKHHRDFENDYQACEGVFVLMGDARCVPVLGYGTSRMKINGNVTRIINSLHVPGLDSDLFSVTKHGCMDYGHSFLFLKVAYCSQNFPLHSLFPKMTTKDPLGTNV